MAGEGRQGRKGKKRKTYKKKGEVEKRRGRETS
jgi:hypothetical protein